MIKKEYLPSKQFVARLTLLAIVIVIVFGVYELSSFMSGKFVRKTKTNLIVKDIIQKDSNNNGIPDWEESLWGLDPTKNGESNRAFIAEKQKALDGGQTSNSNDNLTENEILSREFFATIMSLQQTGDLNDASIQSISDSIGQKIVADPIPDIYTKNMLTIHGTTIKTIREYYNAFKALGIKYKDKDIGGELTFIAQALKDNSQQPLYVADGVAQSYRAFGKELMAIPVPTSLASTALSMANDYEKTAQSIEGLEKILTDPIIGMKAVINYKKYNDALIADIDNLKSFFEKNAIISSN